MSDDKENATGWFQRRAWRRYQRRGGIFDWGVASAGLVGGTFQVVELFKDGSAAKFVTAVFDWFSSFFGSKAEAATGQAINTIATSDPVTRFALMGGVYLILLGCFWFVLFGKRTKAETDRAWDIIKIIAGFFIGMWAK